MQYRIHYTNRLGEASEITGVDESLLQFADGTSMSFATAFAVEIELRGTVISLPGDGTAALESIECQAN